MHLDRGAGQPSSRLLIVAAPIAVSTIAKSTAPCTTPLGLSKADVTFAAADPVPAAEEATVMPRWSSSGNGAGSKGIPSP